MTARRPRISDMPAWPRFLTQGEAASYLGVSAGTFADEVRAGLWPAPLTRGRKGGSLTWDRDLLNEWADRLSGLGTMSPAIEADATAHAERVAMELADGATTIDRPQRRQPTAA